MIKAQENKGLSSIEAQKRLLTYGPNQIFKPKNISFFSIAKHEVTEPMILLLIVVGFFYSIWGKAEDAITIFIVIFLLVLTEVYNEFRAKKAIASLEKIAAPRTRVFRDGTITEIDTEDVVLDDILVLSTGTKVAADSKLIQGINIQVDESALTGESYPVEKKDGDEIYAGTFVLSGEGESKVFATGKNTKMGIIASTLKDVKPPKTALQLAMKSLAGKLVYIAVFFSVLIPLIGILKGGNFKQMVLTGLSLSFATIPEELPIVVTMVLGLGAYTLSKKNFLVKKIKAAETLGSATVIVTDKTGTITENKLKIVDFFPYKPEEILEKIAATLPSYSLSPIDQEIKNKIRELHIDLSANKIVAQRNFGNGRKTKSVIKKVDNHYELITSGAPEEVFALCKDVSEDIKTKLTEETSKGRRVIGIASKKIDSSYSEFDFNRLENAMEFVGLISFEDPLRAKVKETIEKAAKAGIRTIMVTGDHPLTARYIAKEVGIIKENEPIFLGEDIENMSDEELSEVVKTTTVFARATPFHKYRIVRALQQNGEVVAVTGDGINDALALKGADIGIAMGIYGTDVAKEAADVVLADDNYITITQGIFEGRKFFDNLSKGVKYYLSVKLALILIFLLPAVAGLSLPFSPIQIIILELFMDLAASAGFVAEPAEKNIYYRPPRNPKENIINTSFIKDIFLKGFILFAGVTAVYFYAINKGSDLRTSQTLAFTAWIIGHIALAYISRSDKEPVFRMGVFANKIINIWAVSATIFILSGIYIPILNYHFNFAKIDIYSIIYIGIFMVFTTGILEAMKYLKKDSSKKLPASII